MKRVKIVIAIAACILAYLGWSAMHPQRVNAAFPVKVTRNVPPGER